MAKTAAQRQADYRAKRAIAGNEGNGERRLNMWIETSAALALDRLATRYGVTKQAMIEKLITEADKAVLDTLDIDKPEWDEYFAGVTA